MTSITCAVVRDLLPSYVEGLTSQDTNALVGEHLSGCASCRDVLATMRAEMGDTHELDGDEQHEIDFLRHNRRRNRRIVLGSALAAIITIGLVLALRAFLVGSATPAGSLATTAFPPSRCPAEF